MVSHGRLVDRSLSRRKPRTSPRPRVLVLTEGEVTEPEYLNGVRIALRLSTVDIKIMPSGAVPRTLVERAVSAKRDAQRLARRDGDKNRLYDEVWCVFDVDTHPNVRDAEALANANSIKLAISNPSFELWLLLHFSDQQAFLTPADARSRLRRFVPSYEKRVAFHLYDGTRSLAESRAEQLNSFNERNDCIGANPSTSVFKLTTLLRAVSAPLGLS